MNFVASEEPVGKMLYDEGLTKEVSAGDPRHEWTSHAAIDEVISHKK